MHRRKFYMPRNSNNAAETNRILAECDALGIYGADMKFEKTGFRSPGRGQTPNILDLIDGVLAEDGPNGSRLTVGTFNADDIPSVQTPLESSLSQTAGVEEAAERVRYIMDARTRAVGRGIIDVAKVFETGLIRHGDEADILLSGLDLIREKYDLRFGLGTRTLVGSEFTYASGNSELPAGVGIFYRHSVMKGNTQLVDLVQRYRSRGIELPYIRGSLVHLHTLYALKLDDKITHHKRGRALPTPTEREQGQTESVRSDEVDKEDIVKMRERYVAYQNLGRKKEARRRGANRR